jgi:ABC-type Na+ efflux pump permease subunit
MSGQPVPVEQLLRTAQGLYGIFFGVLVAALTFAYIAFEPFMPRFGTIMLLLALGALCFSAHKLRRATEFGGAWVGLTTRAMWLAALGVYFTPIFFMWRKFPRDTYLLVNVLAFVIVGILFLIVVTAAIGAFAHSCDDQSLLSESRLFFGGLVVLLGAPFAAMLVYVAAMTMRFRSDLADELLRVAARAQKPAMVLMLLGVSMTLSLVWLAKNRVMRELRVQKSS